MRERFAFLLSRLNERLWLRPLLVCLLSIAMVILARAMDDTLLARIAPEISLDSLETLLKIMASSMLVIATFSVGSMLSAYASATNTATPRAFTLVLADDVSQNALSAFVGAFIFSIVALVGHTNGYYGTAGRFTLFVLTLLAFMGVILMFVRWVDRIARLGRLGETIEKAEEVAARAIRRRRRAPTMHGVAVEPNFPKDRPVFSSRTGYVQRVDIDALQTFATKFELRIAVAVLPGAFLTPDRPLAYVDIDTDNPEECDFSRIEKAYVIGSKRMFDEDPRFGVLVLSEIASRALSPAVNDPGTAIEIIGVMVRLLLLWSEPVGQDEMKSCSCDRICVPELSISDLFDDAFTGVARDGAGTVEVGIRLQKAFHALAQADNAAFRMASERHARLALTRAEHALRIEADLEAVRAIARSIQGD